MSNILKINKENLRAVIFDLGYSINQIKDLNRGFSFKSTGKLNMMMGINDFSCDEVISNMSEENLNKVFKYFGEEKFSKRIARKIVEIRKTKIINTEDLVDIIDDVKRFKNLANEVKEHDPLLSLDGGYDGLQCYRAIADQSSSLLDDKGYVIVEIGYDQANHVGQIFADSGFLLMNKVKDISKLDRVLIFKKKK